MILFCLLLAQMAAPQRDTGRIDPVRWYLEHAAQTIAEARIAEQKRAAEIDRAQVMCVAVLDSLRMTLSIRRGHMTPGTVYADARQERKRLRALWKRLEDCDR